LALPNAETSILRVAERVAHGGHNIPTVAISRRFPRSLYNLFNEYSSLATTCQCFMNITKDPVLIFEQTGEERNIIHHEHYQQLTRKAVI